MSNQNKSASTTGTRTVVKESFKIQLPKNYGVYLHNNNYTHPFAVVDVLIAVFQKNTQDAMTIMEFAHNNGKALVIAPLSHEIANLKLKEAEDYCKKKHEEKESFQGYTGRYDMLKFTVEEME